MVITRKNATDASHAGGEATLAMHLVNCIGYTADIGCTLTFLQSRMQKYVDERTPGYANLMTDWESYN